MLSDEFLVLTDLGNAAVRGPVRGAFVVERDIDVRVVLELLKLVRSTVRDKHKVDLVRFVRFGDIMSRSERSALYWRHTTGRSNGTGVHMSVCRAGD